MFKKRPSSANSSREERDRVLDDLNDVFGTFSDDEDIESGRNSTGSRNNSTMGVRNSGNTKKDPYKVDSGFGKFSLRSRLFIMSIIFLIMLIMVYVSFRINSAAPSSTKQGDLLLNSRESTLIATSEQHRDYSELSNKIRHLVVNQYSPPGQRGGLLTMKDGNFKVTNNDEVYSKLRFHNSVQGQDGVSSIDFSHASFVLENVCLNKKGELIFYTSNELYESVYKKLFGITHNEKVISFLQTWRNGRRGSVKLNFMFKKTQKDVTFIENTVLAMNRYAAGNLGHLFNDNLVAMNELISKFDLDMKDLSILFMDEVFYERGKLEDVSCEKDPSRQVHLAHQLNTKTGKHLFCEEEMASYHGKKKESVQQSIQWSQILSPFPILQKCTYKIVKREIKLPEPPTSSHQLIHRIEKAPCPMDDPEAKRETFIMFNEENHVNRNQIDMCFRKLVLGVGDRTLSNGKNYGKYRDASIQLLRRRILSNLGLQSYLKQEKTQKKIIKIGILGKSSHDNTIHNSKELEKKLMDGLQQEEFIQNLGVSVEIVALDLSSTTSSGLSMKHEENSLLQMIKLFSTIDMFITNSGSASYWSLFMPENSQLIVTPICSRVKDEKQKTSNVDTRKYCHEASSATLTFHHSLSHLQTVSLTSTDVTASHFHSETELIGQVELDIEKVYSTITNLLKSRFI